MVGHIPLEDIILVRVQVSQHFGKLSVNENIYMDKHYVYMLLCDQKTFYIGITFDMQKRLKEHTVKESFFTKKFSEIKLVYCERYNNKIEAARREQQLKGWSRKKKQMLIYGKVGINCIELEEMLE